MSSHLDERIHTMMLQVVEQSPPPPQLPDAPSEPIRQGTPSWVVVVASAAAILLIIGTGSILLGGSDGSVPPRPPAELSTTTTRPTTTSTIVLDADLPFLWERRDLDGVIEYPTPWQDGYVALQDGEVASSSDGISWILWENQPIDSRAVDGNEARGLVVDGDRLVFVVDEARSLTPRVFVADPDRYWHELPVETQTSAPASRYPSAFLSAGETGIVIDTDEGTWLFNGQSADVLPPERIPVSHFAWAAEVQPSWPNDQFTPPAPIETIRILDEYSGRYIAIGWGGESAWTSVDGTTWTSIDPITVPWTAGNCGPPADVVYPTIFEAGPLGWIAIGSECAPIVVWYSPDGLEWSVIDNIKGLQAFDMFIPYPPVILMTGNQALIYGNAAFGGTPEPAVWIGTPRPADR